MSRWRIDVTRSVTALRRWHVAIFRGGLKRPLAEAYGDELTHTVKAARMGLGRAHRRLRGERCAWLPLGCGGAQVTRRALRWVP